MAATGASLFLLGLASGFALLAISAYRHVSPAWLKWLLIASAMLLIGRYVLTIWWPTLGEMAYFMVTDWLGKGGEAAFFLLYCCWVVSSIGLTLPGVFAIDQLIRHPAMTPKKLFRWYLLFPLANGAALVGLARGVNSFWMIFVDTVFLIFLIGFVGVCVMLWRKIPSPPIQRALLGLALAYGYLGLDILLGALLGRWHETALLYSEMAALLALWYAYETSASLQRSG